MIFAIIACIKFAIKDNKEYEIPLYDIGGVIANSYSLTYSNNLLVKLAELNIPFIITNVLLENDARRTR